jgi:thiosulfate dehydrogenase [quinone] large subunit
MASLPAPDLRTRQYAYVALRLALGLNMFLHGVTRLPSLGGFADGVVAGFEGAILPPGLVEAFATVLPFVEATVGLLLLLGLSRVVGLLLGVAVMLSLIFGTGLQQNWGTIATQMQCVLWFGILLAFLPYDRWALDLRRR